MNGTTKLMELNVPNNLHNPSQIVGKGDCEKSISTTQVGKVIIA